MKFYKWLNETNSYPPPGTIVSVQKGTGKKNYYIKYHNEKWEQVKIEFSPKNIVIHEFMGNIISQKQMEEFEAGIEYEGSGKEINGLPELYALPLDSVIVYTGTGSEYKKTGKDSWDGPTKSNIETVIAAQNVREGRIELKEIGRKYWV